MTLLRKSPPRVEPDTSSTCATCGATFLVAVNLRTHTCQDGPERALPRGEWGERPEPLHGWF